MTLKCFANRERIPIIDNDLDALFNMADIPNPIVINHVNDNHFQAILKRR